MKFSSHTLLWILMGMQGKTKEQGKHVQKMWETCAKNLAYFKNGWPLNEKKVTISSEHYNDKSTQPIQIESN